MQKKQPRKITPTYLHNAGLYYLQRFAASTSQFQRVMQRKIDKSCMAHPDQDRQECQKWLQETIETFQRAGLLNDDIYAAGAIRSMRLRGLSTRAIEGKMALKGVAADLVKRTLFEIDSQQEHDANLIAAVKQARKKRIGPFLAATKEAATLHDKHLAALARAGFDFETALKVLKMDRDEAETLIGFTLL
ncbi:MAG TPA: RecX family transcriptional regulator [Micavibrio sp.]